MDKKNVKLLFALCWATVMGGTMLTACSSDTEDDEPTPFSPYVTQVLDYRPAPGQFVNAMPAYVTGDTQESMNQKVLAAIGKAKGGVVTLGAYGGYVVVGFDHMIENVAGARDFRILGNAFYNGSSTDGGSCEPGIVMVAYDQNKNGKPDDNEWFELAGSDDATSTKEYRITYTRPDENKPPVPEGADIVDKEYVKWSDNRGGKGYVEKLKYHTQSYYPQWISSESLVFEGNLLPPNGVNVNAGTDQGELWVLHQLGFGYADNALNADENAKFDIDWAVNKQGQKVNLPGVDFIKIYTGVNQFCGWIGEVSTEVSGVEDLHLLNNK